MPARPARAIRRRPQARRVSGRNVRTARGVGTRLSRSGGGVRRAARDDAARMAPRCHDGTSRSGPAVDASTRGSCARPSEDGEGRHGHDASVRRPPRRRAGAREPLRLRAEEGLAELRHGAGEGLLGRSRGALRAGTFRRGADRQRCRTCQSRKRAGWRTRAFATTSWSGCSRTNGCEPCLAAVGASDDLVRFHTAHKLTLMAHSPKAYSTLGRLVANAGTAAQVRGRAGVRRRVHAGAERACDTGPARERAATHARVLQEVARR